MYKYISILLLGCFLLSGCTKECCYDGNEINIDRALDDLSENESNDNTFDGIVTGSLSCLNGESSSLLMIKILDQNGNEFEVNLDAEGNFDFPYLQKGDYIMSFINDTYFEYDAAEYDSIIDRLEAIILGMDVATNIEILAYDFAESTVGLSSLDIVFFQRLKDGEIQVQDIEVPWRYVLTGEINTNSTITNELEFSLDEAQKLDVNISAIYFGDTEGKFCF